MNRLEWFFHSVMSSESSKFTVTNEIGSKHIYCSRYNFSFKKNKNFTVFREKRYKIRFFRDYKIHYYGHFYDTRELDTVYFYREMKAKNFIDKLYVFSLIILAKIIIRDQPIKHASLQK